MKTTKLSSLLCKLAALLLLVSGCQSAPVSVPPVPPAKPAAPEVLSRKLPPPNSFQTRLQAIFDSLQPTPTK